MSAPPRQLPLLFQGAAARELPTPDAVRGQRRRDEIQIVEYAPFPRLCDQRGRVGFTRDVSESGMCLGVDGPEKVGSLLRVVVRTVDGRSTLDSLARVVWSRPTHDGRWWLGLSLLRGARRRLARVRYGAPALDRALED